MVIEFKPEHSLKEFFPMCVTLLGIMILVRFEHPLNAPSAITKVPSFMVIDVLAEMLLLPL